MDDFERFYESLTKEQTLLLFNCFSRIKERLSCEVDKLVYYDKIKHLVFEKGK